MSDIFKKVFRETVNSESQKAKKEYASFVRTKDYLAELVYDKESSKTQFAVYKDEIVDYRDFVVVESNIKIFPWSPQADILKNNVILFPSRAVEYISDKELIKDINNFVHKYLQISPLFERIAVYYIMFTWVFDNFNEVPYLRFLGDWGCGKSRGGKTIGVLCYKPIFAGGAITSAPIFRLLENFRGTFIIDEADFKNSNSWNDIIKILNTGYEKDMPVLRTEGNNGKFDTKSFNVFGPKIMATRERFQDQALESRCLTERMEKMTRDDILFNLPDEFQAEALYIRNKLLMWRFKNYGKRKINQNLADRSIEPRLNQIILPLISIIDDEELKVELMQFMREYNISLSMDRGFTVEADVLEIVLRFIKDSEPSIKEIALEMNIKYEYSEQSKYKFSAKKIGSILHKLGIATKRQGGAGFYVVPVSENDKIRRLSERYGFRDMSSSEHVNLVNVVGELKDAN